MSHDLREVETIMEQSSTLEPEVPTPERTVEEILAEALADPVVAERQERFNSLCEAIRSRSSILERAALTAEAKALYEQSHPEARQGGAPGKSGGGKAKSLTVGGFVPLLAQKTNRSPASIHGDIEIAQRIAPEVRDRLRDTPVSSQTTTLLALARLPRKSRNRLQRQLSEAYLKARTEEGDRAAEKALKMGIGEHRPAVERRAALPPLLARTRPVRVVEGDFKDVEYAGRILRVHVLGVGDGAVKVAVEIAEVVEPGDEAR
jgi:hypothetical protein